MCTQLLKRFSIVSSLGGPEILLLLTTDFKPKSSRVAIVRFELQVDCYPFMATIWLVIPSKRKKTPRHRSTCKIPHRLPRNAFQFGFKLPRFGLLTSCVRSGSLVFKTKADW